MAFRISLNKASKAQSGSTSKAEEEAKAREEKNALDKVMADLMDEHGDDAGVLGESKKDLDAEKNVFVPTGAKRHFTGRPKSMKSGPGTLAPEPGTAFTRPGGPGGFVGQTPRFGGPAPRGPAALGGVQAENVYGSVVAKASNLPPAIDPRRIEDLFADFPSLKVIKVERIPPSRPSSPSQKARPSATMKVIFDKDASARDLDDAMNKMNDKRYLGKGYYLHLDRYLGGQSTSTKQQEEPFGAILHDVEVRKGFAPPPDLGGHTRERQREETMKKRLLVSANAPPDSATLRLIHQTIDGVIKGGIEFEAALMQDSQVQEDERFAWLFNQRHPLNRYYRWRMHEIINSSTRPDVFHRQPDWKGPKAILDDEYASELWDLSQPREQDSDDEEDERPTRITVPIGENYPGRVDLGYGVLSPRSRTVLIWMLASLPPSTPLMDEIAAFSVFAVDHVAKGMDEVVHLLVTNIFQPFFFSKANPKYRSDAADGEDEGRKRNQTPQLVINGLRIISDVAITTSKESGACYKYRTVISNQLVERKVFEYLESLPSRLSMGRMGETQYRDEINAILKVWDEEILFDKDTLARLDEVFNARKRQKEQDELDRKLAERRVQKKVAVVRKPTKTQPSEDDDRMDIDQVDGAAIIGMDGASDEKVTSAPPGNPTLPTEEAPHMSEPTEPEKKEAEVEQSTTVLEIPGESAAARARRLRPKAEDMFASDGE
jgi:U2-associated protein SR140